MKIAASDLQLYSGHSASAHSERQERLRLWVGSPPGSAAVAEGRGEVAPAASAMVSLSAGAAQPESADAIQSAADEVENDPRLLLLRLMIEALTGKAVKVLHSGEIGARPSQMPAPPQVQGPSRAAQAMPPPGFGLEYERRQYYSEAETTQFRAQGAVRTADGREIPFAVELTMSRSYREESAASLRLGNAVRKDPLVINFAGAAAQLSDQAFRFDLDADGSAEDARFLAAGSGFLAFDRNGDGRINDGRELFGAITGDGFSELAALDADGNGWIDESDAGFHALSVWTRAADGADRLLGLAASGVGALALAHIATPFELRDARNNSLGGIRASGVYLGEGGAAGTVQQIDLSV